MREESILFVEICSELSIFSSLCLNLAITTQTHQTRGVKALLQMAYKESSPMESCE